ncbi:hypothetical protein [Natrinema sp. SYSU A 869]|uniref:hypothetical protein n=1 Tax=Natrinema sp. SYSU A 869 TaxID=2871694 RepID=UPI001CA456C4|nr:hypothetical protein [Natrinema sp. SYSU A 869]
MDAHEATDSLDTRRSEQFDTPMEQSDPEIYMPGTPTVSFLEYVEIAVSTLFR